MTKTIEIKNVDDLKLGDRWPTLGLQVIGGTALVVFIGNEGASVNAASVCLPVKEAQNLLDKIPAQRTVEVEPFKHEQVVSFNESGKGVTLNSFYIGNYIRSCVSGDDRICDAVANKTYRVTIEEIETEAGR